MHPKREKIPTNDLNDWFDDLGTEQKQDALEGIADAEMGETVPHEEVVKLFSKWGIK